jgi:hypothetical protein
MRGVWALPGAGGGLEIRNKKEEIILMRGLWVLAGICAAARERIIWSYL